MLIPETISDNFYSYYESHMRRMQRIRPSVRLLLRISAELLFILLLFPWLKWLLHALHARGYAKRERKKEGDAACKMGGWMRERERKWWHQSRQIVLACTTSIFSRLEWRACVCACMRACREYVALISLGQTWGKCDAREYKQMMWGDRWFWTEYTTYMCVLKCFHFFQVRLCPSV